MKTWKPTVAGILDIVSGISNLIGLIFIIIAIIVVSGSSVFIFQFIPEAVFPPGYGVGLIIGILVLSAVIVAVQGVIPLIGGIYALQRRRWLFALISSIVAIFGMAPLGIAATIFVAMAKEEFE